MAIGFYNFQRLHDEEFRKSVMERFEEIVNKNGFVEGEYNDKFENEFASMQKVKHCDLVANGTDALEIALKAYGVGKGDKVAIAAISFYATAECVYNVGAEPIFVDVEPQTGLMCPESLQRIVNKHEDIKAIICVHIYGMPANISALEKICKPKNIKIVEDGAQAAGGFYENGEPIGSSGNLVTYSFYPTKNLGAFGDAGAILCNDDKLSEDIRSIRNHGRSPNGHRLIGRNSRCDHLQAAVLHLKLSNAPTQNENRKNIAAWYFEELRSTAGLELVPEKYIKTSSWHLFPVRLETKEKKYALKEALAEKNIGSSLFYEKAMPEEAPLENVPGEKTHAITFAHKTICLPMHPFLTQEDVKFVADTVKDFLK
ncbi:MAG: DegT/DnrJ/EryC1/StrS family aminotransferase [Bacteriovoracaceae bacterium]|jgi:dTDP-4-amino-4,6-dideoxygalactose transaminase|nr:DegT/DnrJ/EryC1/StrS family aminotransferase [Bacteriovoracaceae bacterium]